jgi:hypothetical protein
VLAAIDLGAVRLAPPPAGVIGIHQITVGIAVIAITAVAVV